MAAAASEELASAVHYQNTLIYVFCVSSILLLVWFLSEMVRHPERLVRALNEHQRHQVATNQRNEGVGIIDNELSSEVHSSRSSSTTIPSWANEKTRMTSQFVPCSHRLLSIDPSTGALHIEISLNDVPNTRCTDSIGSPHDETSHQFSVSYTSKIAYNISSALLNRYLSNSESVHAKDLLNPHCIHTLQSHSNSSTISATFDSSDPVDRNVNYPLVVLTVEDNPHVNDRQLLGSIIGVVSLFHIPNPANRRSAALLFQYLVFMDNHFLPLKRLFSSEDVCAVCQVQQTQVCLLPCGHTCLCKDCIFMIRGKCPVCRQLVRKSVLAPNGDTEPVFDV